MTTDADTVEVEIERAGELVAIDVRRGEAQVQQRAGRDGDPLELLVLGGHPRREAMGRRPEAERLLDEVAQLRPVGAQLLEDAGVLAQQLRLFLERVLRRLQAAEDHRVDDAGDLDVGQLAVEGLVMDATEEADHVVLRVGPLRRDVVVDVVLEPFEATVHLRALVRGQLVLQAGPVHERHDHRVTPLGQLRDVGLRKAHDVGHDALGQWTGEPADELHLHACPLVVVDPLVDERVGVTGDHLAVAERADADPRIGELATVLEVQLLGRAQ